MLPLENLSGDKEQEYFADGVTDALISELARIRTVRVISRTSVMTYKGLHRPLPESPAALACRPSPKVPCFARGTASGSPCAWWTTKDNRIWSGTYKENSATCWRWRAR